MQRVQFGPLAIPVLADLVAAELGLDEAAALRLATAADGSVARALALGRLADPARREHVLDLLAGIREARYVRLARMAHELNHPESELSAKLDLLLARAREDVLCAVGPAEAAQKNGPALRRGLRTLEMLLDTLTTLQRSTPNRQLFLEGLLLRMGRT